MPYPERLLFVSKPMKAIRGFHLHQAGTSGSPEPFVVKIFSIPVEPMGIERTPLRSSNLIP
jgi:hypothetical protein